MLAKPEMAAHKHLNGSRDDMLDILDGSTIVSSISYRRFESIARKFYLTASLLGCA